MYLKKLRSRKVVTLVFLSFTLFVIQGIQCRKAEASVTVFDALTAVGISVGSGALLGLSTTAFYEDPTKHMNNVLIGAGIGTIVGVGVVAYMFASNDSEDEIDPEELLIKPKIEKEKKKSGETGSEEKDTGSEKKEKKKDESSSFRKQKTFAKYRSNQMIALVSQAPKVLKDDWAVSMRVLELRF